MTVALLYIGTVLIWGSTWLAVKMQLGIVAPEVSIAYRFALAAAILLIYSVARGRRLRFSARDHLGMASLGLLLFSCNYIVFYLASGIMTTGLVAVVFSRPHMSHKIKRKLHLWNAFHYVLGTKYFDEGGYFELYKLPCSFQKPSI